MSQPPLDTTRKAITELDEQLLSLLAKRRNLSVNVALSKEQTLKPIRDVEREQQLLARLTKIGNEMGLEAHYVTKVFQGIIEDSVRYQQNFLSSRANPELGQDHYRIAFLGTKGSYSHIASSLYCQARQAQMLELGCASFSEIIDKVESSQADLGFLPVENTSSGSINEVYDVLQHTSLAIIGETQIDVDHCLLGLAEADLDKVTTVYGHSQPISQTSLFLKQHPHLKIEYCASSADAMQAVQRLQDPSIAAIGSELGGIHYGLKPLQNKISNQSLNQSRFVIVARQSVSVPLQIPAKTTLIIATGQKAGALVDVLSVFKSHNINMTKLESRPIQGNPWEEMFYIDVEGNLQQDKMQSALSEVAAITRFIKILGCYPTDKVSPTELDAAQLLSKEDSREFLIERPTSVNFAKGTLGDGNYFAVFTHSQGMNLAQINLDCQASKDVAVDALLLSYPQSQDEALFDHINKTSKDMRLNVIAEAQSATQVQALLSLVSGLSVNAQHLVHQELIDALGHAHKPVIVRSSLDAAAVSVAQITKILAKGNQQLVLLIECDVLDIVKLQQLKADCPCAIIIEPSGTLAHPAIASQTAIAIKALGFAGVSLSLDNKDGFDGDSLAASVRELL
ncbi:chorismate mutase [Paraferrimonas sp. SM1919]|uniref:chorismate mutase n=1 Tax=Paraferrimonas sp. SM1919 TaxID=2662263 RepID=UPI0013D556B2|nr:chorismate mutase [Paraferrimonas sp. SM1919]